jgi:putative transposase
MPGQARLDPPGALHHVMGRGSRSAGLWVMGKTGGDSLHAWSLISNHAHILLRSGSVGLPAFMRGFLTGYAIDYNRRHGRHGHLFQNPYKSIVCEEHVYFRKMVR